MDEFDTNVYNESVVPHSLVPSSYLDVDDELLDCDEIVKIMNNLGIPRKDSGV